MFDLLTEDQFNGLDTSSSSIFLIPKALFSSILLFLWRASSSRVIILANYLRYRGSYLSTIKYEFKNLKPYISWFINGKALSKICSKDYIYVVNKEIGEYPSLIRSCGSQICLSVMEERELNSIQLMRIPWVDGKDKRC